MKKSKLTLYLKFENRKKNFVPILMAKSLKDHFSGFAVLKFWNFAEIEFFNFDKRHAEPSILFGERNKLFILKTNEGLSKTQNLKRWQFSIFYSNSEIS